MATRITIDTAALGIAWQPGTNYRLELEQDFVTDTGGYNLPSPANANFKSFTTNDNPEFASSVPPAGSINVVNNTFIDIVFDRDIIPQTGSIFLYEAGAVLVKEYVIDGDGYSFDNLKTITLDTLGLMNSSTTYYINFSTGIIKDYDNFDIVGVNNTTTITFTTGNATIFPELNSNQSVLATSIADSGKIVNPPINITNAFSSTLTADVIVIYDANFAVQTNISANVGKLADASSTFDESYSYIIPRIGPDFTETDDLDNFAIFTGSTNLSNPRITTSDNNGDWVIVESHTGNYHVVYPVSSTGLYGTPTDFLFMRNEASQTWGVDNQFFVDKSWIGLNRDGTRAVTITKYYNNINTATEWIDVNRYDFNNVNGTFTFVDQQTFTTATYNEFVTGLTDARKVVFDADLVYLTAEYYNSTTLTYHLQVLVIADYAVVDDVTSIETNVTSGFYNSNLKWDFATADSTSDDGVGRVILANNIDPVRLITGFNINDIQEYNLGSDIDAVKISRDAKRIFISEPDLYFSIRTENQDKFGALIDSQEFLRGPSSSIISDHLIINYDGSNLIENQFFSFTENNDLIACDPGLSDYLLFFDPDLVQQFQEQFPRLYASPYRNYYRSFGGSIGVSENIDYITPNANKIFYRIQQDNLRIDHVGVAVDKNYGGKHISTEYLPLCWFEVRKTRLSIFPTVV